MEIRRSPKGKARAGNRERKRKGLRHKTQNTELAHKYQLFIWEQKQREGREKLLKGN